MASSKEESPETSTSTAPSVSHSWIYLYNFAKIIIHANWTVISSFYLHSMSAFLRFSKSCRKQVRAENPHVDNTDISRLLGHMWRSASKEEKEPYVTQEFRERESKHWFWLQLITILSHHSLSVASTTRGYLQSRDGKVALGAEDKGNGWDY